MQPTTPPTTNPQEPRLASFLKTYKLPLIIFIILLILAIIVVIFTTSYDDGIPGDDSKAFEDSVTADQAFLEENYGIYTYLPITSADPSYTISYALDNKEGNYSFAITLTAFSASAREPMVAAFLSTNFGAFDPLSYNIRIENYYNPLSSLTPGLSEQAFTSSLPGNFSVTSSSTIGNYHILVLTHTLYDGSTNTYRAVFENDSLLSSPKLFYSYSDLSSLDPSTVRSINSLGRN